jgi:hypothetical protein
MECAVNKQIGLRSETPTYDRSVFEGIRDLCGHGARAEPFTESGLRIEDGGVFAKKVGFDVLDWMPAADADAPGSPNPLVAPLLPFPFTAAQLAAFFLDSWGWFFYEAFGRWETGPDEDLLRNAGVRGTKVREAVRAAYRAGREAQQVVGPLDEALQWRVLEMGEAIDTANSDANRREGVFEEGIAHGERESRRARAREATPQMRQEHAGLDRQATEEREAWRWNMVRQLLGIGGAADGADSGAKPPMGRRTAVQVQDEQLLAAVQRLNFDPAGLPGWRNGTPSPAKAAARKELAHMSDAVFDKAWWRFTKKQR